MPNDGKLLERVVNVLEKALAKNPEARILANHRLPDRVTGRLREHDVVLEIPEGHHPIRIAIECRDRSRPVGVSQIEAFSQKCADTSINRGVVVAANGFCKTALEKAAHNDIACLSLTELRSISWSDATHMRSVKRLLHDVRCLIIPESDGGVDKENSILLLNGSEEMTSELIRANVRHGHKDIEKDILEPLTREPATVTLEGNFRLKDRHTGKSVGVKSVVCDVTFSAEIIKIPFSNFRYQNEQTGELITEASSCSFDFDGKPVTLMILGDGASARSVKLISNDPTFRFQKLDTPT